MLPILLRNMAAGLASALGAHIWTKSCSHLVTTGKIHSRTARKLIHLTTAPLFMLTWPLYTSHWHAARIAAAVPVAFSLRMYRQQKSDPLVGAVSRRGAASEAARGPAAYGMAIGALTALAWRHSAPLYVAVAALCAGDCMADVVGSALPGPRVPLPVRFFTRRKTVAGTAAFVLSTGVASAGLMRLAAIARFAPVLPMHVVWKTAFCAAVAELLPVEDNFTVPFVAYQAASFFSRPY